MKFVSSILLALNLCTSWSYAAEASKAAIELFTSQGCSSCPPADKIATELAADPKLIVISYAVDYWDYLGWKDTLARHEFTERQRAYGLKRGDNQVYTPQSVVNGQSHVIGSERKAIEMAIAKNNLPVALEIIHARDSHKVKIPALAGEAGELILIPVVSSKTVAIGKGENHGRSLTYTNIALSMLKLGDWAGVETYIDLPVIQKDSSGADRYIILLQSGTLREPGRILGATQMLKF